MKGKDRQKKLKRISKTIKKKNKTTKGIVKGNLEVQELTAGNKIDFPKRGDRVVVSYEGRLTDGIKFDSSNKFEFRVGVGEVIKGWDEVVLKMSKGQKVKATIPSHLAYGARGAMPDIPPHSTLIFTIALLNIK